MTTCAHCNQTFEITDKHRSFYAKLGVPAPKICPSCRLQRKLAFRNERVLYKRSCDATGKEMVSIYSPDKKMVVYNKEYWHGDDWNPLELGRDYDPSRSFFEQFGELLHETPVPNVRYSFECMNCEDVLLCAGLKKAKYCILNKQYTQGEYEALAGRIVRFMQQTGEWGQFFPAALSPFGYNETNAHDYYLFTEESAVASGFAWARPIVPQQGQSGKESPDAIADVTETLTDEIFTCTASGKPFKYAPQELALYLKLKLGLPNQCYDERHKRRQTLQTGRRLYQRTCAETGTPILTAFSPESPFRVVSQEVYSSATN